MIIDTLLDLDLYKLSVQQAMFLTYRTKVSAEYQFKCRNKIKFTQQMFETIKNEVNSLANLQFNADELKYLTELNFFKPQYIGFLRGFRLEPVNDVEMNYKDGDMQIIIYAPLVRAMYYETLIMSIVNEVYSQTFPDQDKLYLKAITDLRLKLSNINHYNEHVGDRQRLKIIEFGTRRRFSRKLQDDVVGYMKNMITTDMVGTSNVSFAKQYGLRPIGTFGHEWMMCNQSFHPVQNSQYMAFEKWLNIYGDKLSICLTDTFGNDKMLIDLDETMLSRFKGFRHDSGDPIEWANLIFNQYQKFNIPFGDRTLVFSDGLDIERSIEILNQLGSRANIMFGIGTNLTFSHAVGIPVPQNVIKMTECNNQPVCKLSANPEKAICKDDVYLNYVKHAIKEY
jgi:nicotinate phosphoribosyltransferase